MAPNRAVPSIEEDARIKFTRTKWRAGAGSAGLFAIDLINGAGPSWPALGIVAIAISVFFKWRKLPAK